MKNLVYIPLVILLLIGFSQALRSQVPARPSAAILQGIIASNADLIKRQEQTLVRLQALEEEARQLKTFSKRS